MTEIDWKFYDKLLDRLEQTIGKRDNFTIDDATKYFVGFCGAKVYNNMREMAQANGFKANGADFDDITTFTDFDENTDKYMCYIIPSKKWGGDDYVFVVYDEERFITDFFSQIAYDECCVLWVMCKGWREDVQKIHNNKEEYWKTHSVEEDLKCLLDPDYNSKK